MTCKQCDAQLAELQKHEISAADVKAYESMLTCDCGSTEISITIEE